MPETPVTVDTRGHARRRGLLAVACALLAAYAFMPDREPPAPPRPLASSATNVPSPLAADPDVTLEPLPAERPAHVTLQPGETRRFALPPALRPPLRVRIAEQGVDIDAELRDAATRLPFADDDILRWGEHRLALAARPARSNCACARRVWVRPPVPSIS
jgi:hypothetical protein